MSTPKTALIIGASRGLGLGLVKQLLADGQVADMAFITSINFYVDGVEGTVPGTNK